MAFLSSILKPVSKIIGGAKQAAGLQEPNRPIFDQQQQIDLENQSRQGLNANGYGVSYTTDPITGRQVANLTMGPKQQEMRNQSFGLSQALGNAANPLINEVSNPYESQLTNYGLPQLKTSLGLGNFEDSVNDVRSATFNQAQDLLARPYEKQQHDLDTKLELKGIPVGSQAYKNAVADLEDNQNRAYNQNAYSAILAGGGEQTRLGNLANQEATLNNAANNQEFGQRRDIESSDLAARNLNNSALSTILSGRAGISNQLSSLTPLATLGSLSKPVDYYTPAANNHAEDLASYNNKMGNYQANMNSYGNLLGNYLNAPSNGGGKQNGGILGGILKTGGSLLGGLF